MKPHRARILAMQALFQAEFQEKQTAELVKFEWIDYEVPESEQNFARKIISGVKESLKEIDNLITEHSKNWDIERISPVNKSILRVSIYQLLYMKDEIPAKVIIDEAIKLAKEYAEDDSGRFINGILDACYKANMRN